VGELLAKGQATLQTTLPRFPPSGYKVEPMSTLTFSDMNQVARAEKGLRIRFQALANRLEGRTPNVLDLPQVSPMLIRTTPIGLDPDQVDVSKRNGMMIIARCANPPRISASGGQ